MCVTQLPADSDQQKYFTVCYILLWGVFFKKRSLYLLWDNKRKNLEKRSKEERKIVFMYFGGCHKENGAGLQKEEICFNWWKLQGIFITDKVQKQCSYTGLYFFPILVMKCYAFCIVWYLYSFKWCHIQEKAQKTCRLINVIMTLNFIYSRYLQATLIKTYHHAMGARNSWLNL